MKLQVERNYKLISSHPSTKRMTSQVQEETDLELLRRYQDQNTSGIDHRTIGEKQDAYHRQAQNMVLILSKISNCHQKEGICFQRIMKEDRMPMF